MWQIWQFFMAKFANFCGKIWQNLGFQMAIFCDARPIDFHRCLLVLNVLYLDLEVESFDTTSLVSRIRG